MANFDDNFNGAVACPTERHIACVLLLDTSGSMEGNPIRQLNEGVKEFKKQLMTDPAIDKVQRQCIDIAVITFGGNVEVKQGFKTVDDMDVDEMQADGGTPLGEALNKAMDFIETEKQLYKSNGTAYYRPWIFCITDGYPTDDCTQAMNRLQSMQQAKKVLAYCIGVGSSFDAQEAKNIFTPEFTYKINSFNFTELFKFVSSSISQTVVSRSDTGFMIQKA